MATAQDVINLARRYRGIKESPANSNHQQFGVWYGIDYQPWCAMFASFILYTCGMRFSGASTAKGWSYCPSIADWAQKKGLLSSTPVVGALVLFHNGSRFHHVEIVTKVGAKGAFTSIGGNTGPANLSNGGEVLEHPHGYDAGTRFVHLPYAAVKATVKVTHPAPVKTTKKSTWTHNYALVSPMAKAPDIARASAALKKAGFDCGLPADVFGQQMDKAVRGFQRKVGLKSDGVLGPVTAAHLGL